MKVKVLAFGIARDIVGGSSAEIEVTDEANVDDLKEVLVAQYPRLKQLTSFMVAVNNEYAHGEDILQQHDEVAIIPPVSGG
ncbi:molybdopterin synthase sulfur carrier subunit [Pontibacter ummariensis]|uniref:Molybdopterin synthase sulfur carrier subunit n=1 Tax=Pontibacter ummariensis TaxID=1610492 RepID=A0A239I509_9BACT|nr:molybdopterin converting factor subunit 1 [Pontibacter ummariensis]PRY10210.1 molybdopterin synthase sulfur carrier subunit [Pontibacter ummariensis]SNS88153.1 molybdopterin synthase sulfur carrier subunit [Pontibacter ummariensis]